MLFTPSDGMAINPAHVDRIVHAGTKVEIWTVAVNRTQFFSYPAWSRDYAPKVPLTMTPIDRERAYEVAKAEAKAEWQRLVRQYELTAVAE